MYFTEKILLPGEVRINILSPIPTHGLDDTNVNELAEKTRKGKKSQKCSVCDYSSSNKGYLKKHIESKHEGKKHYKCSMCNNSFSHKTNLKAHMESIHDVKKKNKCSDCDHSFPHSRFNPFMCSFVDECWDSNSNTSKMSKRLR